jgi:hypothetical protein
MRGQQMRAEVLRLFRQAPFQPFVLNFENGDRIGIGHPENIACDPDLSNTGPGSTEFYVLAGRLRQFATFDTLTSVTLADKVPTP